MRALLLLAALLGLSGCAAYERLFGRRPPPPAATVAYVVGAPYQALGVWRYPAERFSGEETGLAAVIGAHAARTTDGEAFDPGAMAAAHPTLQLPAVARVTDLATGRQVLVRVNDRGPVPAGRVLALTRRAAELIGAQDGAPVQVELAEAESRQLAADLGAGKLAVSTAPTAAVRAESLAPPPGVAQGRARTAAPGIVVAQAAGAAASPAVPLRLPEQVTQTAPRPGQLAIVAGQFGAPGYAEIQRRRLEGLGATVVTSYNGPRDRAYRVQLGPFESVASADAMLARVAAAGVADARIVVQ